MKKQTNRLLSLLLSFAMVLGMLPAVTPHVHAEHVNGVTLTSSIGEVTPAAVLDNLVVYDIWTAEQYTLTTTPDNTYGVFFRTYYSREWIVDDWYDEGGYYETDDIAEITLDNVTIRTQNPRHAETAGDAVNRYGALTFWAADMEWNGKNQQGRDYMGVTLSVKGTNTVELLGVENDTPDAKWSAVSFVNCCGHFFGSGSGATLNAVIAYDNAVGEAAALRGTSGIHIGDVDKTYEGDAPVTINAVAQVTGTDGTRYGNGIDIANYHFYCMEGTELNIVANDTGILRRYEKYANWMQFTDSTVAVAAGKAAIINEGVNDDHKLCAVRFENCTVEMGGIYDGSELVDPLDSGINAAGYIDFCETTAAVTAVDIALNSAYDLGGSQSYNHDSYVQIRDDSDVTVTGSMGEQEDAFSSKIAAIDTEAYYAAVYVQRGSKLTVNAGWLAIKTLTVQSGADCEIWVNTTYPSDGGALSCSYLNAFGASASDENSKPLKLRIYSAAAQLGVGKSCEFDSNDVLIHTAGGAPISPMQGSHKIYRGEGIVVMESADGENWQPVSADRNSLDTMRWLTTIPQSSHICANDNKSAWVKVEDADQHAAPCLVCGETLTRDCEYVYYNYYPTPTATKDGKISYKCAVGPKNHYKDIVVPAHNCADYVNDEWEDYGSATKHKGDCTYFVEAAGIPCGNEVYADHTFTEWSGDSLTISRTCTGCGYVESKNTHEKVTHMEAIAGDCSKPGRIEFWHCTDSDCGLYFSDALMTQVVAPEDTFTTPGAHSYGADGVCTVCGDKKTTVTFIEYDEHYYSSDMDGELFILVGFSDGKAYVMGNETNADGSRNAVEIPVKANGAIDADSATAEIFAFDWDEATFSPDGGYMSMMNGKIVVYDKARVDEDGLPRPMIYSRDGSYYDVTGYLLNWTNDWCIVFDAETLTFKVSDTPVDSIVRYKQVCSHENLYHVPGAEATCTEQGAVEYWYCDDCYNYYMNGDLEKPVEIDSETELTKKATGHKFDADGICENCGMKRHVYTQVSTLAEFDALSKDASYIIVFKDLEELATVPEIGGGEGGDAIPSSESGVEEVIPCEDDGSGDAPPPSGSGTGVTPDVEFSGKTYAAYFPDLNAFDQMVSADSDGDGVVDLLETDANANGVPDIIEEYIDTQCDGADADEDGTTTVDEYKQAIGSYDEDEDVDIEDYKLFFSYDIEYWLFEEFWEENAINHPNIVEVIVADDGSITVTDEGAMEFQMMVGGVWGSQPNEDWMLEEYGITENDRLRAAWIPNYWIGASGMMGSYGEEHFKTQERFYGDGEYPGIIDHKNWKISFREDETAWLVDSWTDLEDTGALQLAKYTDSDGNTRMTIVGLPDWQWEYSDIMRNCTALLPAYLYASEPTYAVPPHECQWGDWKPDDSGRTHTRSCTVENCNKTQTEDHDFSKWSSSDEYVHTRSCSVCGYSEQDEHTFDSGTVEIEPTCFNTGRMIYHCTAGDCDASYTEEIPVSNHRWGNWQDSGNGEAHSRTCQNEDCTARQVDLHSWEIGTEENCDKHVCSDCGAAEAHCWESTVYQAPTCIAEGAGNRTCPICNAEDLDFTIPVDPDAHSWGEWQEVKAPAEGMEGEEKRVCSWAPNDHVQTRPIPALEHEHIMTDWEPFDGQTHRQYCMDDRCAHYVEGAHDLEEEVIQAPDYGVPGQKRVYCQTCWYERIEEMKPLVCDTPAEGTTSEMEVSGTVDGEPVDVGAVEVIMPELGQPAVNEYDKYVLNSMDGYQVEAVYDVSLKGEETPEAGKTVKVTLTIGTENARKLLNKELLLVHVTGVTRDIYSPDELEIDVEKGTVTFVTEDFSPFVLAAPPAELEITVDGKSVSDGCSVTVSANASFVSNLMIAVYDQHGKMLAVQMIGNCNLSAPQAYTLEFSGTASYVKAFMLKPDGSLIPSCNAETDNALND